MSWPTPQDYNEAIQSPAFCFEDVDLKHGMPELDKLGLPRANSGAFASVYRIERSAKSWAVKCFLREFVDQQERYAAISRHLDQVKCPYTISFSYLERGIRVSGRWYPILKMEWVQGELLNQFIQSNLNRPKALSELAGRWAAMIKTLHDRGIAHGDLQHGNVIIINGELRLIDYDGMFVPSLGGRKSHEEGHRNYQHPLRSESDFGASVDNFSAWVVYVSLLLVSFDPSLWNRVGGGDECLIFRQRDFSEPLNSATLKLLSSHPDQRVQSMAAMFQSLLYLNPSQIPILDGKTLIIPSSIPNSSTPNSWLNDHVPGQASEALGDKTVGSPGVDASWLFDFISSPDQRKLFTFRLSSGFCLANIILLIVLGFFAIMLPLGWDFSKLIGTGTFLVVPVFDMGLIILLYRGRPEFREANKARSIVLQCQTVVNSIESALIESGEKHGKTLEDIDQKRRSVEAKIAELSSKEHTEKIAVDRKLKDVMAGLNNRRLGVNQEEQTTIKRIQDDLLSKVALLNRQISDLAQEESARMARALKDVQRQFIQSFLKQYSIGGASISGIGPALKDRLRARGIFTAADVNYVAVVNVSGIGSSKARAIVGWRDGLAARVESRVPCKLSETDIQNVKNEIRNRKVNIERERDLMEQRARESERQVRENSEKSRQPISVAELSAKNQAQQELQSIAFRHSQPRSDLSEQMRLIMQAKESEIRSYQSGREDSSRRLVEARWKLEGLKRESRQYAVLTFSNYLRQVFGGKPVAR